MKTISLSIIIPAYNEAQRLSKTFEGLRVKNVFGKNLQLTEIIFVNDGSKDKTLKILKEEKKNLEKKLNTKVIIVSYKQNKGKGYAIRQGMKIAKGEYSVFMDADMSVPLLELKKFVPFFKTNTSVIIGTRKNGHSTVVIPQPFYRQILGRGFTLLSNLILQTWVKDFTCGFKAFNKESKEMIFEKARINGWGYDSELIFLAKKLNFHVKEIPVAWYNDARSKVRVGRDMINSISELCKIRILNFVGAYSQKTSINFSWFVCPENK